jgi:hypothetical protein
MARREIRNAAATRVAQTTIPEREDFAKGMEQILLQLPSVKWNILHPPQPPKGCNATIAVATARGGGEISVCDPQMNISFAAACQSPSLHPSASALNLSDEEEIGIGDWIYKSSRFARCQAATTGAIARSIGMCNPYMNMSHAIDCQLPSLLPSNDDKIGALPY